MTSTERHVVLGGTGVVGRETVAALLAADRDVVSLSRSGGHSVGAATIAVDLLNGAATIRALEAATVAYVTVALPYTQKAWKNGWPVVVKNTIDACVEHGIHLVYFDNVFAYGLVDGPMTETTPIRPGSRKGQVRASLLRMLEDAAQVRGLTFTVGRSADFYGPGASTSVFNAFVIDKVRAGKESRWFFDAHQPHSMTYTPDIGRALAVLGTDPRARGTTWHLPTAPPLTGAEYIDLATTSSSPHRTMTLTTMRIGALFIREARESLELSYQNTEPYIFNSTAFENTFATNPTPYSEGIQAALNHAQPTRAAS